MTEGQPQPVPGGEYADVGQRISRAVSLYAKYPLPFLLISLAYLPFGVASVISTWGLILLIPGLLAQEIVTAALVFAVYSAVVGVPPTAHASLSAATDKLGALIEYELRTLGAALLLCITVVGIPWGIRLFIRWFFGTHAIMLRGVTAKEAISESCRLVTDNWWRTLGNIALVVMLGVIPGLVIRVAIGGVAGGIAGAVWGTIVSPFFAAAFALYYLRLLQEKGEPPPSLRPSGG